MRKWLSLVVLPFVLVTSGCTADAPLAGAPPVDAALDAADVPAARTGDLGIEDLPRPDDLGRGWSYRVDPGNPEDGYRGSGEPAIARDPATVLAAITPLGCRPGRLPMPTRALEVTYARQQQPAVALLLRFDDEAVATKFFDGHVGVIRACMGSRHVDVAVQRDRAGLFVSTRTEQLGETPSWTEGVRLMGDEVMLVAVAETSRTGVRSVLAALD